MGTDGRGSEATPAIASKELSVEGLPSEPAGGLCIEVELA